MNGLDPQAGRDRASEPRLRSLAPPEKGAAGLGWLVVALFAGVLTLFNISATEWPSSARPPAEATARAPTAAPPAAAEEAAPHHARCEALVAKIQAIDDSTHEALPPTEQDRLRALRRMYRDARSQMHC
jgi:hypothetical protein